MFIFKKGNKFILTLERSPRFIKITTVSKMISTPSKHRVFANGLILIQHLSTLPELFIPTLIHTSAFYLTFKLHRRETWG